MTITAKIGRRGQFALSREIRRALGLKARDRRAGGSFSGHFMVRGEERGLFRCLQCGLDGPAGDRRGLYLTIADSSGVLKA